MYTMSSRHFLFFIPAVTIVSLKTYVTVFTSLGGRDTWISTIIALAVIFLFTAFILSVCKKKGCYDLVKIYQTAFGKVFGNVLLALFYMSVFLTLLESTSVEADAMKYNFLLFNPVWGFLLLAVVAGLYIVTLGYRSVLITVVLGIIFISASGITLAALTHKYKEIVRLLPLFEFGINRDFLFSIVKIVASLSSIMIVVPLFKDVWDNKNLMMACMIGLIFVAQVHIVSVTGVLTTFEPALLNTYPFPKLTQTQRIQHFGFMEAGELFVMLQIVGGWIVKFTTSFFILDQILKRIGVKKNGMSVLIAILVFFVSIGAASNLFDLFIYLDIYLNIILVNFFIIPILTFTVFAIRGKSPVCEGIGQQIQENSGETPDTTKPDSA